MFESVEPPQDTRPERGTLWRRLVAGELTEVYVPDKTFVVTDPPVRKLLRSVRAGG